MCTQCCGSRKKQKRNRVLKCDQDGYLSQMTGTLRNEYRTDEIVQTHDRNKKRKLKIVGALKVGQLLTEKPSQSGSL